MEEICKLCGRSCVSFKSLFIKCPSFCVKCLKKAEEPLHDFVWEGCHVTCVHEYSQEVMGQLVGLKGNGEIDYKDILIPPTTRKELRNRYKGTVFVYMPSTKVADEERGFRHLPVLFEGVADEECFPLYKKSDFKQSNLSLSERRRVSDKLGVKLDELERLKGKRVVLVDDVMTSGSTLLAARELLGLSEVEFLVCLRRPLGMSKKGE